MDPRDATSARTSFLQLIFSFFFLLIFTVIPFLLSGDWYWPEGRVFSAIFFFLSFATVIHLYIKDPALLNERFGSPAQKGQKFWDKVFIFTFFTVFLIWYAIMPLDARRFGWSPRFPLWIKITGTVLYTFNFIVMFGALKENTFAAPVVKMQSERGQKVISSGLYGVVRHPMYLGGTLLFIGAPLLLGSIYGLAIGILLTLGFVFRIFGEEAMLKQKLDGYDEYMKKVRWRLIPYVF